MLVVKDNALIGASYNLDVVEQRLILLAIVEARESGKGINANDALTIHASSYMQNFNVEKHAAYKALKDASKDLFARQFSYQELSAKGNVTNITSRWVSQIGYTEDEASVQLIFSPAIVPLITRLEERFTSYELSQVAKLGSKYAMRLYELLIAWRSVGKLQIELQDLRNKLGLSANEYKAMGDFKRNVLDLALTQLNEHTDISVKYEQHKKGRVISGFTFRFKVKTNPQSMEVRDTKTGDLFVKLSDAQRSLFGSKLARDPRIQSEYAQKLPSDSYEAFGKALADMLLDENHFKTFYPILVEYGYTQPKA
ncbi:replication initiation protein [Acinetobacter baumannii]|uniref:replication initiation protein RepM n=1 Tax=Acinetobacter baumannii TaxID=470 RepID=UPI0018AFD22B|nr:replication initiation protein RepM [Acinetobacter baumannii]MBF9263076.1 replication initiation protein [Acinetobacter baumannii]